MDGIIPPVGGANTPQLNLQAQILDAQNQTSQISKLPIGQILTAVVVGNDKNGNLVVRMGNSDLVLNSQQHLVKGATLQLKLDSISGSMTAQLLTVDGKLPATQPQQTSNQLGQNLAQQPPQFKLLSAHPQNTIRVEGDPKFVLPQQIMRAEAVTLSAGNSSPAQIKGIIINPTPEIMQGVRANLANSEVAKKLSTSLPEEIKTGTQVNVRVTGTEKLPQQQNPNQQVSTENRTLAKQDWMVKQQNDLMGNLIGNAPIKDYLPTMKQAPSGNLQLSAMVLDSQSNGEVLVDTKLGKMLIQSNQPQAQIERGTILTMEITEFLKAEIEESLKPDSKLTELGKSMGSLKELAHHAESKGVYTLPSKLAGTEQMAARIHSFMEAVKNNSPEEWVGKSFMDALGDDLSSEILSKLKADFGILRGLFTEPNQQGWQSLLFPVFDGKELQQARLHVKDLPERRKKEEKKTGVRFIMELETTYFGEMQFDGLVRKTAGTNFDLIVRSHKEVEPDIKQDIKQIFITASKITGFKGEIQFASMREFPVKPFEEILEADINKHIKHEGFEV